MNVKARLEFRSCLQNMQDVGTNHEFMRSRVSFSVQLPDKRIDNLSVDLKQTAGDDYKKGSIEVEKPPGAISNLDYATFRDAVEKYYRYLIGSSGKGIRIQGGSSVIMQNNLIIRPMNVDILINTENGGW